ncbi:MAG TPA: hypothetical protein VM491_02400, partial [Burkholderiaceae bacterium]|nr:hypothetical protein [Burkholderiaceae bacterium]
MAEQKSQLLVQAKDETGPAFESVRRGALSLQQEFEGVNNRIKAFMGAGAGVARFLGIGGALSLGGLSIGLQRGIHDLAAMSDAAKVAGTSVENLSSVLGVAAEAGLGLRDVTGIMQQLGRSVLQAEQDTSKAAQAFRALRIDPKQFSDSRDLLMEVARELSKYEDGANKTRLAIALLGRAGAENIPFLTDLSEKGAEAARVFTRNAQAAEALEKHWRRLSHEAGQLRLELASQLVPWVTELATAFANARRAGFGFFESLFHMPIVGNMQDQIRVTREELEKLEAQRAVPNTGENQRAFDAQNRLLDAQIMNARRRLEVA